MKNNSQESSAIPKRSLSPQEEKIIKEAPLGQRLLNLTKSIFNTKNLVGLYLTGIFVFALNKLNLLDRIKKLTPQNRDQLKDEMSRSWKEGTGQNPNQITEAIMDGLVQQKNVETVQINVNESDKSRKLFSRKNIITGLAGVGVIIGGMFTWKSKKSPSQLGNLSTDTLPIVPINTTKKAKNTKSVNSTNKTQPPLFVQLKDGIHLYFPKKHQIISLLPNNIPQGGPRGPISSTEEEDIQTVLKRFHKDGIVVKIPDNQRQLGYNNQRQLGYYNKI